MLLSSYLQLKSLKYCLWPGVASLIFLENWQTGQNMHRITFRALSYWKTYFLVLRQCDPMDFQSTVLSMVFWWWRKNRQQFLDSTAAVFWVLCSNNFQPNCKLGRFKMSSAVMVFKGNVLFFNADTLLASRFRERDRGATCARLAFPTLSSVPQLSGIKLLWL